jgi:hypothetical protein
MLAIRLGVDLVIVFLIMALLRKIAIRKTLAARGAFVSPTSQRRSLMDNPK